MGTPAISVFGLGYVGSVTAASLAARGCEVVGCDVAESKVDSINAGRAPIGEPGLEELLSAQREAGKIRATTDAAEAVRETNVSIVCVGTPSTPSGALDLRYVEAVSQQIAEAVSAKRKSHAVVFRSTMLPGSTKRLAETYFAEVRDLVTIFFFPEFLRQGTALADFNDPSLSAIGLLDETQSTEPVSAMIEAETVKMSTDSAELLKYACNAFHASKVAFANEIGRIGKAAGIDASLVMETLCKDERLNISTYYMRPGTPFGGSCLPKDVSALVQHARHLGISAPMLDSLLNSNRRHLESILERVENAGSNRILLLGLAFKEGTDDLRGSAMLELAASLLLRGFSVQIYDPEVAPENLVGANKRFADTKLPSFESLLLQDLSEVSDDDTPFTIVVSKPCVSTEELGSLFAANSGVHVIDVNGWAEIAEIAPSYEGVCW